jgi:hypothetical protein
VGAAAPGTLGRPSVLTLHDLATSSPLQLSTRSSDALAKILSSVPANTVAVTVTATDVAGGEVGVAVAARVGDHWTVGCVFDVKKTGPKELGFQLLYTF